MTIGSALTLFAVRAHQLSGGGRFALLSRETLLLVNNVALVVAGATVLLGTLYPHFQMPIPSMAIVQFQLDRGQGSLTKGYHIDAGSSVESVNKVQACSGTAGSEASRMPCSSAVVE